MVQTNSWDWNNIDSDYWSTPAEDMYYFLHRWKANNLLKILDLGCGIGRHCIFFAENGFDVTGFDLSKNGLDKLDDIAKEKNLIIKTIQGDNVNIPFNDNEFDAIVAYHSIYHLGSDSMTKVIKDIARILKSGGEIYFSMISKSTFSLYTWEEADIIDANTRLVKEEDGSILPHFFVNYEDIVNLFSEYFDLIKVRHIEDIFKGKSSWHYFIHARKK